MAMEKDGSGPRPIEAFAKLLCSSGVTFVADVRTVPRSRTIPQYNRDVLPDALAAVQIETQFPSAASSDPR